MPEDHIPTASEQFEQAHSGGPSRNAPTPQDEEPAEPHAPEPTHRPKTKKKDRRDSKHG